MLRNLYDWTMSLAGHRHAVWWLAAISFIESSVFPIPPDVMLVAMVLAARERAWYFAAVCTVASVLGGFLGYGIGYYLFESVGRWVIDIYHLEAEFGRFAATFNEYGAWIVLAKGMTPIPYKLITITAGVTHLDLPTFAVASLGSRAIRFLLVAWLLWQFGAPIRAFIEKRLGLVTTGFLVALVGGFFAIKLV
ncbi:MAG: DedA family protein [Alphaproteobacteria bacterium]|nr:DedA family protein [Alphaproteobacteria bacterium]MCF8507083.1 DedA family protein [Caulobacter sp.]